MVDRSNIANILVEILAFLEADTGLGVRAVAMWPWAFDIDHAGDVLLSELVIAFDAAGWVVASLAAFETFVERRSPKNIERSLWQLLRWCSLRDTALLDCDVRP